MLTFFLSQDGVLVSWPDRCTITWIPIYFSHGLKFETHNTAMSILTRYQIITYNVMLYFVVLLCLDFVVVFGGWGGGVVCLSVSAIWDAGAPLVRQSFSRIVASVLAGGLLLLFVWCTSVTWLGRNTWINRLPCASQSDLCMICFEFKIHDFDMFIIWNMCIFIVYSLHWYKVPSVEVNFGIWI